MSIHLARVALISNGKTLILKSEKRVFKVKEINILTRKLNAGDLVIYSDFNNKRILLDRLIPVSKHQPLADLSKKNQLKFNLDCKNIIIQSRHCRWIAKYININNK